MGYRGECSSDIFTGGPDNLALKITHLVETEQFDVTLSRLFGTVNGATVRDVEETCFHFQPKLKLCCKIVMTH